MFSFFTRAPRARRTLYFGSAMHVWSDLFFALMVPLLPFIKDELDLSFTEVGLLRSTFIGATAVLQVPAGYLAESVGEFWMLIAGNAWVSLGLLGMAAAPGFVVLMLVSGIAGLGGGTQHPLASSMVSRAYDDRGRSAAVGTVNFAGDMGKLVAPLAAGLFAVALGWRGTMVIVGVAGLVFMLASTMTRRALGLPAPAGVAPAPDRVAPDAATHTSMSGFVILSGLGVLDSAARAGALVFLPFVMASKDMGPTRISAMLFLLFAGGAVGKLVVGWLGDRFDTVSLIWVTKGLTALTLGLSMAIPALAMAPVIFLTGVGLNGTSSVLYAAVAEFVPGARRARFYGFYYTTNEIGTIVAPLAYGVVADLFGLNAAMVVLGIATATILPSSLTLRGRLGPRNVTEPGRA